jgi:hypothetical protein
MVIIRVDFQVFGKYDKWKMALKIYVRRIMVFNYCIVYTIEWRRQGDVGGDQIPS